VNFFNLIKKQEIPSKQFKATFKPHFSYCSNLHTKITFSAYTIFEIYCTVQNVASLKLAFVMFKTNPKNAYYRVYSRLKRKFGLVVGYQINENYNFK
jgi:hypothetical protein